MTRLRVRVECGSRVELHEVSGDAAIGRAADCELQIDHDTVAPRHARICLRRGRVILVDLGGSQKGVRIDGTNIGAPVTLNPGDTFEIGEVSLSVWPVDVASLVGQTVDGFCVFCELDALDDDVRRFRARAQDGREAELVALAGVPYAIDIVEAGMRLSNVVEAVSQDNLHLPIETAVVVLASLCEAVADRHRELGPHGAVEPRLIHLTRHGAVRLLGAGPSPARLDDPARRPYLAPERRYGGPPTKAADAWSVAALAGTLVGARRALPAPLDAVLEPLSSLEPSLRSSDVRGVARQLRDTAHALGLDPSVAHVQRLVGLYAVDHPRPLANVRAPTTSG